MKRSTRLIGSLSLILTVIMISCTNSPIFYSLEMEQSTSENRGLEDTITVHRLVKAGGLYFAAAGTIYSRPAGGDWSAVPPPPNEPGALCNTLEVFDPDGAGPQPEQIYAGFFRIDGTGAGLFRSVPSSIAWNPVTDADFGTNSIIGLLKTVGTNLFVSARSNGVYKLCYSGTGNTDDFAAAVFSTEPVAGAPITDIAFDGTNHWVTVGAQLYSGVLSNLSAYSSSDPAKPDSGTKPFGGLIYSSPQLIVSGGNGKLFSTSNGGATWSSAQAMDPIADPAVELTTPLTSLMQAGTTIYVGTKGSGYVIVPGGDITAAKRFDDPTINALYNGAVLSFYFDNDTNSLFACTYGSGLWRLDISSSLWKQE